MWQIQSLTSKNTRLNQSYFILGNPIKTQFGNGAMARLMFNPIGFVDIREVGIGDGLRTLSINGSTTPPYAGTATIEFIVQADDTFTANIHASWKDHEIKVTFNDAITPLHGISSSDYDNFQAMLAKGLIPYKNVPLPGQPKSGREIFSLAVKYFPLEKYREAMAYSIYDWTTSNFFRFLLFSEMAYTGLTNAPLDVASIQKMIWEHYFPPNYCAENKDFMGMFGLGAAQSQADVTREFTQAVADQLKPLVASEFNILKYAVLNLPRISTTTYPKLYRGAMPLNTRDGFTTSNRFGASMMEFSGNSGPLGQPLEMSLQDAKDKLFADGNYFVPKACWSFTDDYNDAVNYQNGIIITVSPPPGYDHWPSGGLIQPFSVNPHAVEFNFPMRTRYKVTRSSWEIVNGQKLLSIEATLLGTFD